MHKHFHLKELWKGRVDLEESIPSVRLHERVEFEELPETFNHEFVFLGCGTDEGVKRNQGRIGAAEGPHSLRKSLANTACRDDFIAYDLGDIDCVNADLDTFQHRVAESVTDILQREGRPLIFGGGHEIGWSSYLGAQQYLQGLSTKPTLGIINFDAHFDLRNPSQGATSGTPFRQAAQWASRYNIPYHYRVIGLNPSVNTQALFSFAQANSVDWIEDIDCFEANEAVVQERVIEWLENIDVLYLTICMDVFSSSVAPGVSAPAALGIDAGFAIRLIRFIKKTLESHNKKLLLCDIAELNPTYDVDMQTSKLAARIAYELMQ